MPTRHTNKISHQYYEANQTRAHYRENAEISTGHTLYPPHSPEVIEGFSFTIWAGEQESKDLHLNSHLMKTFLGWFLLQSDSITKFFPLTLHFIWTIFASRLFLSTPCSPHPSFHIMQSSNFFLALSSCTFPIYLTQTFLLMELILFLCTMLPECSQSSAQYLWLLVLSWAHHKNHSSDG